LWGGLSTKGRDLGGEYLLLERKIELIPARNRQEKGGGNYWRTILLAEEGRDQRIEGEGKIWRPVTWELKGKMGTVRG